jgi:hypothetical protein
VQAPKIYRSKMIAAASGASAGGSVRPSVLDDKTDGDPGPWTTQQPTNLARAEEGAKLTSVVGQCLLVFVRKVEIQEDQQTGAFQVLVESTSVRLSFRPCGR